MDAIILGESQPSLVMEALAQGLRALGYAVRFGRQQVAKLDDVQDADLVCVWGMSSPAAQSVVAECHRINRPVIIYDHPLLRWVGAGSVFHDGDHLGLYRRHVGHAWDVPCSTARLTQLEITPHPTRTGGKGILLMGQVPRDASHNIGVREYFAWVLRAVNTIRDHTDAPITWRPHPSATVVPPPVGCEVADPTVSLHDQIRDYAAAVTLGSAAQYVAYLEGVPVSVWQRGETWPCPVPQLATERLAQASWNTWSLSEIRDGQALMTMIDGPPPPDAVAMPDTVESPKPKRTRKRVAA